MRVQSVTQKNLRHQTYTKLMVFLSGSPASPTLGGLSGNTGDVPGQCCAIRRAAATPLARGVRLIESRGAGAADLVRVVHSRESDFFRLRPKKCIDCVIEHHAQLSGFLQHFVVDEINSEAVWGRHSAPDDATLSYNITSVACWPFEARGGVGTNQSGPSCPLDGGVFFCITDWTNRSYAGST